MLLPKILEKNIDATIIIVCADLPGFYYDAEKNRYFPIKGPIPGSKRTASAALATCSSSSKVVNYYLLVVFVMTCAFLYMQ